MGVNGVGNGTPNNYAMAPQGVQGGTDMSMAAGQGGPGANPTMPPPKDPNGGGMDASALEQRLGQYSKAVGTYAAGAVKEMFDLPYKDGQFSNLKGMAPEQAAKEISAKTGVDEQTVMGLINEAAKDPSNHSMDNPMEKVMTHIETQGAWAGQ